MIIAHVLSSFALGGQERVALELSRAQRARGHRVLAVSLAPAPDGPLADEFRASGVTATRIPKRGAGFDFGLPLRLARLLRAERVDVVHSHNPQPLIYGAPAAKLAGAAAIHTKHGKNPVSPRRRWLMRAASAMTHAYVAVAPTTARVAEVNRECNPDKLRTIPNGIDVERFRRSETARRETRAELGIDEAAFVIGTVGRLAPEKDQALLLRAALPLLGPERRLVVVGDGPERAALAAIVASAPAGRWVHLLGARPDPERWLSCFDVFVLSSRTEGLPLVIPEAMAAENAVISSSVGGIPDVLEHGVTGLLFEAGDAHALRAELSRLADDPERVRELGRRARAVAARRYSHQRMAADYEQLYQAALAARRRPAATAPAEQRSS